MASSQKFTMMFTCIKGHKAKNWQFSWFVLKFFFKDSIISREMARKSRQA